MEYLILPLSVFAMLIIGRVLWKGIAGPCGGWIADRIKDPYWKRVLTKDRGGYY